ncbi:MAG: hypothetical protein CMK32_04820 [Porticoccaceae bacterium]|nr:hypothetical protein [Porticoccaceae bacterium]
MNKKTMHLSIIAALALPLTGIAAPATLVSDEVSLRAALDAGQSHIIVSPGTGNISVTEPLVYGGEAMLKLDGHGLVINAGDLAGQPVLHLSNGADADLSDLSIVGPGGYSIENTGGGKGIFVEVPETREGIVNVKLTNVLVSNTGNHGVHISDCSLGDDCGGGQGGGGDGSPASIHVELTNVTIDGAGFGKQDADGIRVDDRGDGGIVFNATGSTFVNVGGDGVELDEGNEGDVQINVRNSHFENNGAYCSDEFVDDPLALDPACNDDGDPDVDDAFDIDEAGPGSILGNVTNVDIIANYDEGLDFDSEGEGSNNAIDLDFINIYARNNADEAIKVSEEGGASVRVYMRNIDIGGDVEVEEEDEGDLQVSINASRIGDDLKLSEEGDGNGNVKLRGTTIDDDKDFNNIDEI